MREWKKIPPRRMEEAGKGRMGEGEGLEEYSRRRWRRKILDEWRKEGTVVLGKMWKKIVRSRRRKESSKKIGGRVRWYLVGYGRR